jgi:nitroimidazol reductase NimA-like FMN-containing flavoprotein (pyridoxamine 5'-phosphate oxidase superfamily)
MSGSLTDVQAYLDAVRIPLRLACKTKTGWPVVVSLWFLHQNEFLYCATQKTAKIVEYLMTDARCAFEIAEDRPPYCGIRGQARANIDENIGKEILEKLLLRYLGDTSNDLAKKLLAKSETEVAIVLEPRHIVSWDFSNRMSNLRAIPMHEKICP